MKDVTVQDGWKERPAERFDSRTFVTERTYTDAEISRGHIAYYGDENTVEACLDGEYTFSYHDSKADAFETVEREMARVSDELDESEPREYWVRFMTDKEGVE